MQQKQATIINPTGLHARPAADFVAMAKQYKSRITVGRPPPAKMNSRRRRRWPSWSPQALVNDFCRSLLKKKRAPSGFPPIALSSFRAHPPHKAPHGGNNYTDYNFVTELCISGVHICIWLEEFTDYLQIFALNIAKRGCNWLQYVIQ